LRTHVKLLYEPYDDNLVRLTQGGLQIKWLSINLQS
jgi:hypothetical protein